MWKYRLEIYFVVLMLTFAFVAWQQATNRSSVERAEFLLKCNYEWDLSNEQCEAVLDGEPLPPVPDDIPGC